jgi:hypothetical protein
MKRLIFQSLYYKLIYIVLINMVLHVSFHQLKLDTIDNSSPGETSIGEKLVNQIDFATRRTSSSNTHYLSTQLKMVPKCTFERLNLSEDLNMDKCDLKTLLTSHRHPFHLRI